MASKNERDRGLTDTDIRLNEERPRGSDLVDPRHVAAENRDAQIRWNDWNQRYHRPIGQARNNR